MSEIPNLRAELARPPARDSGQLPWRSLKILIAPAYPSKLITSLVVVPHRGHPHLHPFARALESAWWPQDHAGELETYAAGISLLRLSQTQL